jgi:hypothetical protein
MAVADPFIMNARNRAIGTDDHLPPTNGNARPDRVTTDIETYCNPGGEARRVPGLVCSGSACRRATRAVELLADARRGDPGRDDADDLMTPPSRQRTRRRRSTYVSPIAFIPEHEVGGWRRSMSSSESSTNPLTTFRPPDRHDSSLRQSPATSV